MATSFTGPKRTFQAAEAGFRDFDRGPGSQRRMEILKELREVEAISQRMKSETIEQYGTVAAARERGKEARAVAGINANAQIQSASLNARSRKQVAHIQEEADELVAKIEGHREVLDKLDSDLDDERREGWVVEPTKLYASGRSSDAAVAHYLLGIGKSDFTKKVNNELHTLKDATDRVIYAASAQQKSQDTVERDVATMNSVLLAGIQADEKFATPEEKSAEYARMKITDEQRNHIVRTMNGQLATKAEDAGQAKATRARARQRLDELRVDDLYGKYLAIPDLDEPGSMADIEKLFGDIEDPESLKDLRSALKTEYKGTTTKLGLAHYEFMERDNPRFLADLYGFDDTVDAVWYFLHNPDALRHAVQVSSDQTMDEARAELGTALGIERFTGAAPSAARLRVRATMIGAPATPEDYREGFEPEPGVEGDPLDLDEDMEVGDKRLEDRKKKYAADRPPGTDPDKILAEKTAEETAAAVGEEEAAKIAGKTTTAKTTTAKTTTAQALLTRGTAEDQNQRTYDNLPPGRIKEAYGRSVGIIPTEPGESQQPPERGGTSEPSIDREGTSPQQTSREEAIEKHAKIAAARKEAKMAGKIVADPAYSTSRPPPEDKPKTQDYLTGEQESYWGMKPKLQEMVGVGPPSTGTFPKIPKANEQVGRDFEMKAAISRRPEDVQRGGSNGKETYMLYDPEEKWSTGKKYAVDVTHLLSPEQKKTYGGK